MAKYKRGSLALARQVFNTPQLVLAEDLQNIAQYLVNRANGVEVGLSTEPTVEVVQEAVSTLTEEQMKERRWKQLGITNEGKRGNLEITGTLVAKAGEIDADCMELTSYEKLFSTFSQQVNEGVQELVLHVDSGGGSAFSCFEMAREVKALAVANDIPIYAYVDGLSASAAYAWTSIADEIIARPDSEVGSVGVVVQLINNSKMLENIGITRQFVYHGDQKIPFTDSGDFSPQFIASIQKKVDKTGLEFNTFVAKNRNKNVEDIIATQAEVFDSQTALEVGFIDKIMTKSEFFNDYLPKKSSQKSMFFLEKEDNMTKQATLSAEELQVELSTVQSQLEKAQEDNKKLTSDLQEAKEQLTHDADVRKQLSDLQEAHTKLLGEVAEKEHQSKLDARQAKLEAALGKDNEQVATLLASTESLEDAAFDVIAQSLTTSVEKKQEQLKEIGGEGQQSDTQLSLGELIAKKVTPRK